MTGGNWSNQRASAQRRDTGLGQMARREQSLSVRTGMDQATEQQAQWLRPGQRAVEGPACIPAPLPLGLCFGCLCSALPHSRFSFSKAKQSLFHSALTVPCLMSPMAPGTGGLAHRLTHFSPFLSLAAPLGPGHVCFVLFSPGSGTWYQALICNI